MSPFIVPNSTFKLSQGLLNFTVDVVHLACQFTHSESHVENDEKKKHAYEDYVSCKLPFDVYQVVYAFKQDCHVVNGDSDVAKRKNSLRHEEFANYHRELLPAFISLVFRASFLLLRQLFQIIKYNLYCFLVSKTLAGLYLRVLVLGLILRV